jgi:hypothetical protein
MRGDIIDKVISKTEADIIMRALVSYYVDNDLYHTFIIPFNEKYLEFDHNEFIEDYFSRFERRERKAEV